MRILAALFATAVLGATTMACTLYVLKGLSETDALPVDAAGPPDECQLVPASETNACSQCITQQCSDDVEVACTRGEAGTKSWWEDLVNCAEGPYVANPPNNGPRYACGQYDNPDATPIGSNDDPAKERHSELCVRDKCIRVPSPPCKQCPITVEYPGNTPGEAPLDHSPCGQCLADKCSAALVSCCIYAIDETPLKYCAYTEDNDYKSKCADLGGDADPSNAPQPCDQKLRSCYAQCKGSCP